VKAYHLHVRLKEMNLRHPHSAASNACCTLSLPQPLIVLCLDAVLHILVLTGFVWASQLLKCIDRSSPEGKKYYSYLSAVTYSDEFEHRITNSW